MLPRSVQLAAAMPLLAAVLLCGLRASLAFNVLPSGALVFSQPPGHAPGDYFGYSVALTASDRKSWLIVSAPRATSRFESKIFTKPGALFRCPSTGGDCKEMHLIQGMTDAGEEHPDHISNGTLGGSMDAILGNKGMVVCNPGYKQLQDDNLDMPGICYWIYKMVDQDTDQIERRRLLNNIDAGTKYSVDADTPWTDYGTAELGFSVHQLQEEGEHFLIGAPGFFAGRGTVALFLHNYNQFETNENFGVAMSLLTNDSYFGYAVSAGRFESSSTLYVGGAPRAAELQGKVIVFDYKNLSHSDRGVTVINVKKELKGDKIGEYFGASLAVADVNNDGFDDLIVGAPFHSQETGDGGKVYLYLSSRKDKNGLLDIKEGIMPKRKIPSGRFGTAIAALGDIDKDGYEDIAIGAPYENSERGSIYIYYGSPESPYLKYEQRIRAADVNSNLRGFGFSFSRGGDIDSNTYNDMGVGAYLSDRAVLLRTSPVLRFNSSLWIGEANNKIPMHGNQVELTVCVRPNELLENTGVEVSMNIDPVYTRGSISGKKIFKYNLNMTARKLINECRNFKLTLKNNTKIYKPLEIELSYTILYPTPKGKEFCKTCPVMDFKRPKAYHHINYHTGCANQVCKTNLTLQGNFTGVGSRLVIGSNNMSSIEMILQVANSLEASYETNVTITHLSAIKLRKLDPSCQKAKTNSTDIDTLICEVPYMLNQTSAPFSLNIRFDMESVPWDIDQLQVNISVQGSGEEQYKADDRMTLLLELQHIANITIKGRSEPENMLFAVKRNDSEDYIYHDRTFVHIYTVVNNGPSPVTGLRLKYMIPHMLIEAGTNITYLTVNPMTPVSFQESKNGEKISSEDGAVSGKFQNSQYLNLDCSLSEVVCLVMYYDIPETLYAKRGVTFAFRLTSPLRELGPLLKQSGVIVRTAGRIENEFILNQDLGDKMSFNAVVETTLSGKVHSEEGVQDWIIIVAIICGVLIFAILCAVLWKLGFFKRNKPPTPEEAETEKPDTADKVDTDPLYEENP